MKFVVLFFCLCLFGACSHHGMPARETASTNCNDSIRPEYHSYFDSVEKCIEKDTQK